MQHLLQPRTLNRALLAAAGSALVCYPRLAFWTEKKLPVPFLLFAIFICSIVLWGFVFAWHTPYTNRRVFFTKFDLKLWLGATLAGIVLSLACKLWLDPAMRAALPEDYPSDLGHWLATLLFAFALGQLFLTFAPFDWLMRLCGNPRISAVLTAAFGASITVMRLQPHAGSIPTTVFLGFLASRFLGALLAVLFYLRGGVVLAWWWAFLFELRLLPEFI